MAKISAAGVYTAKSGNQFSQILGNGSGPRPLVFSGNTLATTVEVGTVVNGVFQLIPDCTVTALPDSFAIFDVPNTGLAINVQGGSPDFEVTS